MGTQKHPEAIHYFLQASDLHPTDPRPYACLAIASSTSGDEIAATSAAFKRFHDLAPSSAEANYYYALSLWGHGAQRSTDDMRSIETSLLKAIQLNPQFAQAHFKLAILYTDSGDYEHAIPEYEAALRSAPSLTDARYRLAIAYSHVGRTEEAAKAMQLFKDSRAKSASKSSGEEVSIEQFISVFDQPERGSVPNWQCPVISR